MIFAGTFNGQIFGVKVIRGTFRSRQYQDHVKQRCIPEMKQLNGGTLQGAIIICIMLSNFLNFNSFIHFGRA